MNFDKQVTGRLSCELGGQKQLVLEVKKMCLVTLEVYGAFFGGVKRVRELGRLEKA